MNQIHGTKNCFRKFLKSSALLATSDDVRDNKSCFSMMKQLMIKEAKLKFHKTYHKQTFHSRRFPLVKTLVTFLLFESILQHFLYPALKALTGRNSGLQTSYFCPWVLALEKENIIGIGNHTVSSSILNWFVPVRFFNKLKLHELFKNSQVEINFKLNEKKRYNYLKPSLNKQIKSFELRLLPGGII